MSDLEFHSLVRDRWLPAEQIAAGDETFLALPRDATIHLRIPHPNGQTVVRRHVPHLSHVHVFNLAAGGRCKLCKLTDAQVEAGRVGRVYRSREERASVLPEPTRETEPPADLPEPETLEQVKEQRPRRVSNP